MRPRVRVVGALSAAFLLMAPHVGAQQVTGRVVNQLTGQPLAAVQVFIAGSGVGAFRPSMSACVRYTGAEPDCPLGVGSKRVQPSPVM